MSDTEDPKEGGKKKEKISVHDFYFETPLYKVMYVDEIDGDFREGSFDAYNYVKQYETTYKIEYGALTNYVGYVFHRAKLKCSRSGEGTINFFFLDNGEQIEKIGQTPSMVDIQYAEVGKKYDKLLSKGDLSALKLAIAGAAHGIGAGSFVYLRRIFENLIKTAYEDNKSALQVPEKFAETSSTVDQYYGKLRMDEKVDFLKEFLPSQLVKMKNIYRILSKGVHEMSEDDCKKYFHPLKLSIELILNKKIEAEAEKKKNEAVEKQLAAIGAEI